MSKTEIVPIAELRKDEPNMAERFTDYKFVLIRRIDVDTTLYSGFATLTELEKSFEEFKKIEEE